MTNLKVDFNILVSDLGHSELVSIMMNYFDRDRLVKILSDTLNNEEKEEIIITFETQEYLNTKKRETQENLDNVTDKISKSSFSGAPDYLKKLQLVLQKNLKAIEDRIELRFGNNSQVNINQIDAVIKSLGNQSRR